MVRSSGAPEIELTVVSPTPRTVAVEGAVVIAATYGATLLELDATRRRAGAEGVQPHDGRVALHGTVVLLGTTAPQPAALMSLDGIDDAFGGPVRIIAVHQSVALGRWTTRVAFRADRG